MLLEELDIFSVPIKKFQFQKEEITPLLNEYQEKKKDIIQRASFYQEEQSISDYATDFQNPITLHEYEKLIILIRNYFENNNYIYRLHNYWTSIYNKKGYHKEHTHNSGSHYSPVTFNFASVLHLTSVGGTEFYSPHFLGKEYEYSVKSNVGLLVIFPSSLLHTSPSSNSSSEKVVISANMGIYSK
tara:strand:- start:297 stop:854 length:558 start_codon:yes stop_codon:yes gene_type:complete